MSPRTTTDGQNVAVVHERLRAAILYGELEAGASVPQGALATDFGVGRTPLREALRLLQREGLVIAEPNRPVRIATLSADDFEQLYVIRISLEAVAIGITVPTLTLDDFAELEGCMAKMDSYQKAGDQAGFRAPHRAFHHRLVAASGERVSAEIAELTDHSERYRLSFGGLRNWDEGRAEHRAILDAATDRDADLAVERLAVHYARTAGLVFGALDPDHDLSRLRSATRRVAPGALAALDFG
jgi:DNA-binding GntR family transcriptional regulator